MTPIPAQDRTPRGRSFWAALVVIEVMTLVLHLNGLRVKHVEGDEVTYSFLAVRLAGHPLQYHVRGTLEGSEALRFNRVVTADLFGREFAQLETADLKEYPFPVEAHVPPRNDPALFESPVFHHPPLYFFSLALFQVAAGLEHAVLLSSICHALAVWLVAVLGRRWAGDAIGLAAGGLLAIDATSWICGERIWIDAMLQAAVTGAMLAAVWAADQRSTGRFAWAGLCLGLAGLVKFPAAAAALAVLVIWLQAPDRPSTKQIVTYLACAALPVLAWMVVGAWCGGKWVPLIRATPELIEHSQFIRRMVNRPVWYYPAALALASPALLYGFAALGLHRRERWVGIAWTWALSVLVILSVLGLAGVGFQLRYLAPAIPALCLLAARGLWRLPLWARLPVLPLAAHSLWLGMTTALIEGAVDPLPPMAAVRFLSDLLHTRVMSWIEGLY